LKKEAKTFATALAGEPHGKSFLVLFFKKEPLALALPAPLHNSQRPTA